ncbi:MAG: ATP-binding protein [Burkholderiales bacterium]|nr:ATP-binding protein [Burkholderiales bacterium]
MSGRGARRPSGTDALLRAALEAYPDPACLCDAEDRILFVNRAFLALNPGLEPLLAPGRRYAEHLAAALDAGEFPDKAADPRGWLAERLALRARGGEFEVRRGAERWLLVRDIRLPGGETFTLCLDISARRRAEQALREAVAELQDAQARMRLGTWKLYPARRSGHWSAQMYRLFGRDPALGPPPWSEFLRLLHPEDRQAVDEGLRAAIRERASASFDFRIDPALMPLRYFTATVDATAHDGAGEPVVTGTVQDITERKLAEQAIRELNETLERRVRERTAQLEAAIAELESFSYSVSHDLRAPIRAMGAFARMVIEDEGERLSPEGRRMLGVIEDNARRLGALVDDLLTLARVSRAELARAPLDLAALARAVAAELEPRYPGAELAIAPLPPAEGDATLVRQALVNLLDNALKYSARAERPRVEVGWDAAAQAYFVRDNGVGFDMAYAGKLFRPFERLHAPSEYAGTGIGLAIVKRVVERHGGRVWAEAAPGAGATFWFTLGPGR